MATVPGPFASVMVDSGFHLDRPRPPPPIWPARVRGLQVVATGGASIGAGGAAAGEGKSASGGRRSVSIASGHGVSSAVLLPDDTANTLASAGELSFFGAGTATRISSMPRAAGGRALRGRVVVAAKGGSPRDGGDNDDSTKAKEEQFIEDGKKYIVDFNPEEAMAQSGNRYQDWLKPARVDDVTQQEVTGGSGGWVVLGNMTMYTMADVLMVVRDFNPKLGVSETFLVCKEKVLLDFFGRALICGAKLLEDSMRTRPPTSINHEALATIGMELKEAALECQNGFLQSKTLDRAIEGIMRLRATSLGVPEDNLGRLDIRARLPEKPSHDPAIDNSEQIMTYFIRMAAYIDDVMRALIMDLPNAPAGPY